MILESSLLLIIHLHLNVSSPYVEFGRELGINLEIILHGRQSYFV